MAQWYRTHLPMQEMQETQVQSLEEDIATLSSILARISPRTEETGGLWSVGLQGQTQLSD